VKKIVLLLLLVCSAWGELLLFDKVRSLIGTDAYERNEAFIKIIFSERETFVEGGRLNIVRVLETLKENGLLSLQYRRVQPLELTFRTNGSAPFFMTLMSDTLREMGYAHYLTDAAVLDNTGYTWRITMTSDTATDPTALQRQLSRRGCSILDIERVSETQWRYFVDMGSAHLELEPLQLDRKVTMKRLVYPRWLDVSGATKLTLWSLQGNNWYPYIAFYDDELRLLKLYKRDRRSWQLTFRLPRGCAYVKIADLYSRKNMNAGLRVMAQ